MNKIYVVTLDKLNRALGRVTRELDRLGIWNEQLAAVEVYLSVLNPTGLLAYGWKYDGRAGCIEIPAISLPRLSHRLGLGSYVSLADVLRHEYGHAVSDLCPQLIRSKKFREVFDGAYACEMCSEFDPNHHVSNYAASNPSEDFAEVFMTYVRHRGQLPLRHRTPGIRRKWQFVKQTCRAIGRGPSRW